MEETHFCKSNSSLNKPLLFYKLIVDSNDDHKLRIPGKFIKKIGDELSTVATLSTPCGHICYVGLEKEGNKLWFCEGWKEFMQTFSICAGHFLVFKYEGGSKFCISIFNLNSSEVNYLDLLSHSGKLVNSKQCQRTSDGGPTDNVTIELLNQKPKCSFSEPVVRSVLQQCEDPERTNNRASDYLLPVQKLTDSPLVSEQGTKKKGRGNAGSLKRTKGVDSHEDGFIKSSDDLVRNINPESYRAKLRSSKYEKQDELPSQANGSQPVTRNSHDFGVRVSKNSCKNSAAKFDLPTPEKEGQRIKASKRITQENEYSKCTKKEKGAYSNVCPGKTTQNRAVQGNESAIEAATIFSSNYPFCRISLRPSHINERALLHIPSSFARKYLKSACGMIMLKVSDCNHWPVRAIIKSGAVYLSKGWNRFVRDMRLVEGDVCVFELIKTDDVVLKVTIFRDDEATPSSQLEASQHPATCVNDLQESLQASPKTCIQICDPEVAKSAEEVGLHTPSTRCNKTKRSSPGNSFNNERLAKRTKRSSVFDDSAHICQSTGGEAVVLLAKEKAVHVAETFKSSNPFCSVTLMPSYMYLKKVFIPSSFAQKYLQHAREFIKLEVSDGKQWPVGVLRCRRGVYLSQGWAQFMKDVHLLEGYVCVFELIKTEEIVLKVTIFGDNEIASTGRLRSNLHPEINANGLQESAEDTVEDVVHVFNATDDSVGEDFHTQSAKCDSTKRTTCGTAFDNQPLTKCKKRANVYDNRSCVCQSIGREVFTVQAKEKAIHVAEMFTSSNPFCRVTLTPSYMYKKTVYIPSSFAQKYLQAGEFIKLEASDGKQWSVRVIKSKQGACLSQGWKCFMRDLQLLDRDVCVFELIKTEDTVLKVTVFRDIPTANQPQSDQRLPGRAYGTQEEQIARGCNVQLGKTEHLKAAGGDEFQISEKVQQRNETDILANKPMDLSTYEPVSKCRKNVNTNISSTQSSESVEGRVLTVQKKEKAFREAATFTSSNPFCRVSMYPSYLSGNALLHMPLEFSSKYLSDFRFIILEGPDKKQWPVRITRTPRRASLGRGWRHFARINKLDEGDICIFEQIATTHFKVTIFRIADDQPANLLKN